jgi:hypothetical protein
LLPIYNAISLHEKKLIGGSTNPWLVNVLEDGKLIPYVVKLFKKDHIEKTQAVAKEVFGALLAHQFDLSTPAIALIHFGEAFIKSLPEDYSLELRAKDERIKFGSKFIEGAATYSQDLDRNFLKRYDIEDIYAFDNLIFNVDRKPLKPNILLLEGESHLIDHELCLSVNSRILELYMENHWIYNFKNHIFHGVLKNGLKRNDYFSTFGEHLRRLNTGTIEEARKQLEEHQHPVGDFEFILNYLSYIRNSSSTFINILQETLIND